MVQCSISIILDGNQVASLYVSSVRGTVLQTGDLPGCFPMMTVRYPMERKSNYAFLISYFHNNWTLQIYKHNFIKSVTYFPSKPNLQKKHNSMITPM